MSSLGKRKHLEGAKNSKPKKRAKTFHTETVDFDDDWIPDGEENNTPNPSTLTVDESSSLILDWNPSE